MSNEVYLFGIIITGIASAVIGGLIGTHLTLTRATSIIETLRQDKPWEMAVASLYHSIPANAQGVIQQGANLLKQADGLAEDILNSSASQPVTPPAPPAAPTNPLTATPGEG